MSRRGMPVVLLAAVLALLGTVPATAAPRAFEIRDGVSQPIFSFADAIRETVWVDTGLDLDHDGVGDRVAADIIRPATARRVPVIMDASPYYQTAGRGNEGEKKTYDSAGRPVGFPLFYDNYFVPRGYAVVLVDLAGTSRSLGCLDVGGPSDVTSAKAVVDWLNGRAAGHSAPAGGSGVAANWTSGAVGMIGKSWDGTIANGVAATGVPGLRTVVPISAISSWYDWFRSDGVAFSGFGTPTSLASGFENANDKARCGPVRREMTDGAAANGDYNAMWARRNYVPAANRVRASVFVVHGQQDFNVKPINYGQWWPGLNVPRKIWLSQTGHVDPFDFRRADWVRTLHRWFDRWLLDVPNGIDGEPQASVERAPGQWADDQAWPPAGVRGTQLHPSANGTFTPDPGTGQAKFTDDGNGTPESWLAAPDQPSPSRVLFRLPASSKDLRIAGTSTITVTASPSTSTAHLSAFLVDYGPATVRTGSGIRTLDTESCWGESRPGDDACYRDTEATTASVDARILSRGWADLANYASLNSPRPLTPGTPYTMTFRLSTVDHVVPAGHRLALIIGGTDHSAIVAPASLPSVTVDLPHTTLTLPIAP